MREKVERMAVDSFTAWLEKPGMIEFSFSVEKFLSNSLDCFTAWRKTNVLLFPAIFPSSSTHRLPFLSTLPTSRVSCHLREFSQFSSLSNRLIWSTFWFNFPFSFSRFCVRRSTHRVIFLFLQSLRWNERSSRSRQDLEKQRQNQMPYTNEKEECKRTAMQSLYIVYIVLYLFFFFFLFCSILINSCCYCSLPVRLKLFVRVAGMIFGVPFGISFLLKETWTAWNSLRQPFEIHFFSLFQRWIVWKLCRSLFEDSIHPPSPFVCWTCIWWCRDSVGTTIVIVTNNICGSRKMNCSDILLFIVTLFFKTAFPRLW